MTSMDNDVSVNLSEPSNFFKYLIDIDSENKKELSNIVQYAILAIVPVLIILKSVKHFIPEEDNSKGNLELSLEIIGQIVFIFVMMWYSDRIIRYIPTYSGSTYQELNPINFILPFLIIMTTLQTKFGFKINILVDRLLKYWNGETVQEIPHKEVPKEPVQIPTHQNSQADNLDTNQLLPSDRSVTNIPQTVTQTNQDFSQMYQNSVQEPMAANSGVDTFGGW
tara:strand:+ start:6165 stop:6833 length:669 start_codon:yes stop_codon:yes gene_type:complete